MTEALIPFVTTDNASGPSRRGVLRAAAVSGAAIALLGACGGEDDAATDDTAPEEAPSPSEASDSPTAEAGGTALVATADVPVGGGVILEAEKVVVTQPEEGTFKAFSAVCTHKSCTVASVKADTISCACHGSAFSAKDGSVVNGPATKPLAEIAVTVEGDQIVQS